MFRNDRIIYDRGYGMADLEHDIPLTPSSVFYLASLSKQFTAASIVLLLERGKLKLSDPVRKYIPELPGRGAESRADDEKRGAGDAVARACFAVICGRRFRLPDLPPTEPAGATSAPRAIRAL